MNPLSHNSDMKILRRNGFLVFFIVFTSLFAIKLRAQSAQNPKANIIKEMTICQLRNGVRTLEVTKDAQGQCNTVYTKGLDAKVVGSGMFKESCLKILENVKSNLEKAGWVCRAVKDVKTTNLKSESESE